MATVIITEEDRADPYSTAIQVIKQACEFGFDHSGAMSEGEYETLKSVEEFVRREDNA